MCFDFEVWSNVLLFFSDNLFKTTQDFIVKDGINEHFVNFISCRWVCTKCADKNQIKEETTCTICMPASVKQSKYCLGRPFNRSKSWSFYSTDRPLDEFIDWLIEAFDPSLEVIIFSHNGGR